jgi:hypothetical protein
MQSGSKTNANMNALHRAAARLGVPCVVHEWVADSLLAHCLKGLTRQYTVK